MKKNKARNSRRVDCFFCPNYEVTYSQNVAGDMGRQSKAKERGGKENRLDVGFIIGIHNVFLFSDQFYGHGL
jgi:hypothetical protein